MPSHRLVAVVIGAGTTPWPLKKLQRADDEVVCEQPWELALPNSDYLSPGIDLSCSRPARRTSSPYGGYPSQAPRVIVLSIGTVAVRHRWETSARCVGHF